MSQICVLHGWSDSARSFVKVREFLEASGFTDPIWLGDYISTQDDVRVEDVARRMQAVVQDLIVGGKLTAPFDLVVHSTGGLVAREWLARYYPDGTNCPLKRLVMLAPANFGSKLATMGKSLAGRIVKGWNQGFQSGTRMLEALELASPYQWDLARRDLFDAADGKAAGPYGAGKVWPFTIVGTAGYRNGFQQLANENGSDGTVRAAAANLQAQGFTIDFSGAPGNPDIRQWHWRAGDMEFPCAVLSDHDHGTITDPAASQQLGELIIEALRCKDFAEYGTIGTKWSGISEATVAQSSQEHQQLHQFMQLVLHVRDELGNPVDDYFMEFFPPPATPQGREKPDLVALFHREVLEHVHVNSLSGSRRCLYVDRTDLFTVFYDAMKRMLEKQLAVRFAIARSDNVTYFDDTAVKDAGWVLVHDEDDAARASLISRMFRNRTHLIEVIVPRQPGDKVFKFAD